MPRCSREKKRDNEKNIHHENNFVSIMSSITFRSNLSKGISLQVDAAACQKGLTEEMLATDIAYYLVKKGVSV